MSEKHVRSLLIWHALELMHETRGTAASAPPPNTPDEPHKRQEAKMLAAAMFNYSADTAHFLHDMSEPGVARDMAIALQEFIGWGHPEIADVATIPNEEAPRFPTRGRHMIRTDFLRQAD